MNKVNHVIMKELVKRKRERKKEITLSSNSTKASRTQPLEVVHILKEPNIEKEVRKGKRKSYD